MINHLWQEKKKVAPVKQSDVKRTRRDRGELEDIMFKLFERQPNWALKQLVQETDQPAVCLLIVSSFIDVFRNNTLFLTIFVKLSPQKIFNYKINIFLSRHTPEAIQPSLPQNSEFHYRSYTRDYKFCAQLLLLPVFIIFILGFGVV